MTMQTDLQAAVDKATAASAKLHDVVHGDAVSTVATESGPVKTVAKAVADIEADIDASRVELDQKVTDAAASAAAAQTARVASETAETASNAAQLGSEAAETGAATSESNAATAKIAAEVARDAASVSAGQAAASQSASAVSESGAAASAAAAATSETNAGAGAGVATTKATEASASAGAAATSASASAVSASEASGAAASLNLPTATGQAGQYLRQKQDETGLEYAAVDLASRVAKSGDTMTGELIAPTVKSGGDTALDTGFRLSDGTDLGTKILRTSRQSEYADNQVGNCQGLIPNGNCNTDPNWLMPDANWWTWGLGLSPGNPNGYDFAGGQTTTNTPVPTVNAGIFGGYYLQDNEVGYDVNWRDWSNCNCGPTNCYSNCNCNCNCACDCDCDCGDA